MNWQVDIYFASGRSMASDASNAAVLATLLRDEDFLVRRQPLSNEHAVRAIVDLLVRAGASTDVRSGGYI